VNYKVKTLLGAFFISLITTTLLSIENVFAQTCTGSLGDPVVNVTFGTGAGFTSLPTATSGASTTYNQQSQQCPNDGNYAVSNATFSCFGQSWFDVAEDHTVGDVNGRMAIFNASYTVGEFYKQTISGLCGSTTYEFAAWIANLLRPNACSSAGIDPNLTFRIESLNGVLLGSYSTGSITESNVLTWKQYGFVFTTPANQTQVIVKIINNTPGGCGNDLLLDDITFRPCGPTISVTANVPSICEGGSVSLSGSISAGYTNPQFQWQQSSDNGSTWSDIVGAISLNTSVASAPAGTKYRLLAAEQGNITIGYCRIASNPVALTVYAIPKLTLPTTSTTPIEYCAGTIIDLTDFSSTPTSTFTWQLNNTAIGLNQTTGTGQVPVFTATNMGNSPITGTFTVSGSANGCTSQSQTFSVVINPKPAVNLGADQAICAGNSTALTAVASGGTPAYTYSWDNISNNNTSQTVSPSATTIYNVTVTDAKGCKATDDLKVTVNQIPTFTSLTKTDAICYGQPNGTITVTGSGTAPLQYRLDNNAYQNSNVFNAVAAGTYTVTIKDANGCMASKTINVNQPNPMSAEVTIKNVSCFDGTDGAITVNVNGGTSPYSYSWSDGTTGSNNIVGRPAGTYTVTVKDGKGCTTTSKAVIEEPIQISITGNIEHVSCNGGSDGKIDVTAKSIVEIKSYEWKNSKGTVIATTEDVEKLTADTYTVTVVDADGCKLITNYTIKEPAAISVTAMPTNTTCFGGNDGKITVSASGGTGTLQYALCSGSNCTVFGANQTSNLFSNLTIGTYRIRVTDANGCSTITSNITISQAAQLLASPSNTSPVCIGSSITLSAASAGTGVNYEWTGPNGGIVANTQQFNINNAQIGNAGTYTVRVYNTSGCQNTATTVVKINALPNVNAGGDQTVCDGTTVSLSASTSGGTASYTYTWNNGLGTGAPKIVIPTLTTDYIVSVVDANGCGDSDTVRITVIPKPQIFTLTAPNDLTICAGVDGIPLTLSSSQTGVLYE
jgi:large repetitive protein